MLEIKYIDIDKIIPYKNNAKIHTAEQINQIKQSIKEFGMNDPIAIWNNNEIIEGHGRLIACKELGIKKIPIIELDQLSNEQRKAYMLIHNQLTLNTPFDTELLKMELENITGDMEQYGIKIKHEELELDVKDENFIDNTEITKEKKPTLIECPYCGEKFKP